MRWRQGRQSTNVRDVRGRRMAGGAGLGGGALLIMLVVWLMGGNPLQFLQTVDGGGGAPPAQTGETPPPTDEAGQFMSAILAMTEDVWTELFAASGERYTPPTMVLFSDAVQSACGTNSAAVGPFYCPADQKVYIDLTFFRELDQKFGAPGDFAQAYVIAHEVGHHLQTLLGVSEKVMQMRQQVGEADANRLSVMQELQADCFAGVWGHHANRKSLLEAGDVEEGMQAAAAIGDDVMQRRGQGRVSPESWTHGSSEQRAEWLRRGLSQGTLEACDTFGQGSRR
jgi:predicted metalloprotease